jgi:4-hydroxy-tetrahydrodipicolinate synthase
MVSTIFAGSLVAIVTPFQDDGSVDWQAWSRLIDFHLQGGTTGLVVGGTTGESPTLTEAELVELTHRARQLVAGRMQIIVGCGTSCTATTVERVQLYSGQGVDGLLLVTPVYNRPTQQGLFLHFEAAARVARVPVILYNVPSRTAVDLLPETVVRLARVANIAAIKEAVPSMQRFRDLAAGCPAGFSLLSGDDATARDSMANGASGVMVTGNRRQASMRSWPDCTRPFSSRPTRFR